MSLARVRERVKAWYEGEWVAWPQDPSSSVIIIPGGDFRRHWTARFARTLVAFWLEHWKWVIGIAVAVAALLVKAR